MDYDQNSIQKWHPINNHLKVFIDPFMFMGKKNIEKQVLLIGTFQQYFKHLDPNLCDVTFYHPKYIEDKLNMSRTYMPHDKIILLNSPPKQVIEFSQFIKN